MEWTAKASDSLLVQLLLAGPEIPPVERWSTSPDLLFCLDFGPEGRGEFYRVEARTMHGWRWLNFARIDSATYHAASDGSLMVYQPNAYVRSIGPALAAGLRIRVE